MMIERGADVNARNNTGETPLHSACWKVCLILKYFKIVFLKIK